MHASQTMSPTTEIILILAAGAAVMDLRRAAIDNFWILFWFLFFFFWQCLPAGPPAWKDATLGLLIPFLPLFPFFLFRMIGAGDIKLLMALGAMHGPAGSLQLLWLSFLLAAAYAVFHFLKYGGVRERLRYFLTYAQAYLQTGQRRPYLRAGVHSESLHMALPIFLATLLLTL